MSQILNLNNLHIFLFWLVAAYAGVAISMGIDLLTAFFKCRRNHIKWESDVQKRSADKALKYFLPMFVLTLVDCLAFIVNKYPVFTLALGAFCVVTEWFSVFEHTHTKQEQREAAKTINVILKNKADLVKAVEEILKQKYNESKFGNN